MLSNMCKILKEHSRVMISPIAFDGKLSQSYRWQESLSDDLTMSFLKFSEYCRMQQCHGKTPEILLDDYFTSSENV